MLYVCHQLFAVNRSAQAWRLDISFLLFLGGTISWDIQDYLLMASIQLARQSTFLIPEALFCGNVILDDLSNYGTIFRAIAMQ